MIGEDEATIPFALVTPCKISTADKVVYRTIQMVFNLSLTLHELNVITTVLTNIEGYITNHVPNIAAELMDKYYFPKMGHVLVFCGLLMSMCPLA